MLVDPFLLHLHISEIQRKSEMVRGSAQALEKTLTTSAPVNHVFFYLHSILFNSAAVSLSFFPPRKKYSARGAALRAAFSSCENLNVLKDRSLRDHIVHFDERLDDWYRESKYKNIAHGLIGPRDMVGGPSIDTVDIFEHYIPSEGVYIFRGDEFNIVKLVKCIDSVHVLAGDICKYHWADERFILALS
ncbi:hypothetical protein [Rhodovulum sp. P5]|uniref:hypothetical protein n=1 Tax=Rhodovulum sp. P5 TaxID=1564506 RepID=UPI0012EC1A00|nr:hypothetical protein [Rhodovulum sp. P5]